MYPWETPGAFSILSYIEHAYGVYHIKEGLNKLTNAMAKVALEEGVKIQLNTPVKQLLLEGKRVKGVELETGEVKLFAEVIVNADFGYAMTNLIPKGVFKKYSEKKLQKKSWSCSSFMLYLGVNETFDLPHHSI